MSRDLPITPNLEHLRKQAKHRLAEMQRENPALQLADAQHARRHVDRERRALAAASAQSVSQRDDARRGRRNRVSITDIVVDAEGRSERRVNTFEADGVEHPSVNGYSLTVSWRGSRAIETLGRKDGDVIGHGTYEVSPDGMTMTIEGEHQRIVLERLLTSG